MVGNDQQLYILCNIRIDCLFFENNYTYFWEKIYFIEEKNLVSYTFDEVLYLSKKISSEYMLFSTRLILDDINNYINEDWNNILIVPYYHDYYMFEKAFKL